MKKCQNMTCREHIEHETAIFCPFCGKYQVPAGWHFHGQPLNLKLSKDMGLDFGTAMPHSLKLDAKIHDCLMDGNILIVLHDGNVTAYDMSASLLMGKPDIKWRETVGFPAKIVILRPYVIVIESGSIRGIHLETGDVYDFSKQIKKFDFFSDVDSIKILPVDRISGKKRKSVLIIANEREFAIFGFDGNNQLVKSVQKSPGFNAAILSLHIDDADPDAFFIYSRAGERARIGIDECLENSESEQIIISKDCIYKETENSLIGVEIAWVFSIEGVTYFLGIRNNGDTEFLRSDENGVEMISNKLFNKKQPCAGISYPFILFESGETNNRLYGYHLNNQQMIEYDFDSVKFFNIEGNKFRFYPDRLLYFFDKYWAVCPCHDSQMPFQLVSFDFRKDGSVDGESCLYLNLPSPYGNSSNAVCGGNLFEMLPLIKGNNRIVSYVGDHLIIITG